MILSILKKRKQKIEISALASGSSGNCFYVSEGKSSVLIDAGISCRQIAERLSMINKSPEDIGAIFITHEHSDHVRGADVFARAFNVPLFATEKTIQSCFLCSDEEKINKIKNNEAVNIGKLKIEAFSKPHKASDPVFFRIEGSKKLSIITDLGYPCKNAQDAVSDSDFVCLESNHDIGMLENGPYPYYLKKWIKSDSGHLSNRQSSLFVLEKTKRKLKNIMLSHLSEINNTPRIALSSFKILKERQDLGIRLSVSTKDMPTRLMRI
ncbi:MBL fold metallo-hydrolase [Candidatus Pacearchaeota archaeon]|nr:MBL fold metallo-hydrolase [Candidatus Pacearchaeota archaeon]